MGRQGSTASRPRKGRSELFDCGHRGALDVPVGIENFCALTLALPLSPRKSGPREAPASGVRRRRDRQHRQVPRNAG